MTRTHSDMVVAWQDIALWVKQYIRMYVCMPIGREEYRTCLHFANAHLEAQATYRFSRMALHKLCPSQHIRKVWFSRHQLLTLSTILPTFRPDALAFYTLEKASAFDCNVGKIANS